MTDGWMNWRRAAGPALLLALAGCGGKGTPPAAIGARPTAPAPAVEVDAILALLDAGEAKTARRRVAAALRGDPMNPSLLVLRDSLDRDPVDLLGPVHHPYTVRAGDTMTGLAQRFLGNRLKAYQLARYNGVDRPANLLPGRVIRIPGTAPASAGQGEPDRPARKRADTPRPAPAAASAKAAQPKRPVAAAPAPATSDPGAARAARAAGLAALNQGQVGRAVGLLRRAARLDPANPLARRDLARAERIASAVQARR